MNKRLCLTLAGRIDDVLQRDLGQGVDLARMLAEPLYQRDVLLVCDAQGGGELAQLAKEFRAARRAVGDAETQGSSSGSSDSGFSPSRFFNSLFGALGMPVDQAPPSASKGSQRGGAVRGRRK